jgi:hypothetical protein
MQMTLEKVQTYWHNDIKLIQVILTMSNALTVFKRKNISRHYIGANQPVKVLLIFNHFMTVGQIGKFTGKKLYKS